MYFRLTLFLTLVLISNLAFGLQVLDISSPNKEITVSISNENQLTYEVIHLGNPILQPSSLGFQLSRPEISLTDFEVIDSKKISVNETWEPVFGEKSRIKNTYNELTINLQSKTNPAYLLNVIFRVFDDGVGFRYEFPEQPNMKHFVVAEEQTEFSLTGDHKAFWIPGDYETNEYLYNTTKLSEVDALEASEKEKDIALKKPIGKNFIQTPLLLVTESGYYISLHEAALVNYPVMHLELDQKVSNSNPILYLTEWETKLILKLVSKPHGGL
jgi:glucan 1,4-alpha-glucosidase